jgi:hypothetical protein
MKFDPTRALITYSGLVTAALLWLLLSGAASPRTASFATLDVQRINVRESDGTLRMVIASHDRFPGTFVHNKEMRRADRSDVAGMEFINDEGTEDGGLVYGGKKVGGKVEGGGHLSFDQYDQDQVINLEEEQHDGRRYGGLTVSDYPDNDLFELMERLDKLPPAQRGEEERKMEAAGELGHRRLFLGKSWDRDSLLELRDGEGRARLRLRVTLAGDASIEFLDGTGKVVRTVTSQELIQKDGAAH